ncbi:glycerol uptake operon antiterminator [Caldicoprobacter guelmensis]|uniref:glycerol-3-phosphate responsive antiterminator n=1 Tax=Caldicoprobacter guelmensis TaxID=1170224 RepID=UPI00195ADEA1|nr:glycerol-3-phosphate responsive antiterminator [Caldicoprobacter guelmensis]MBM7581647.1 glycerol uptake operon antiterminator [Caldicoprobacter guelmensis]
MESIIECLETNPIIAALPHTEMLQQALDSSVNVVFLLSGSILTLQDIVGELKDKGKKVFVHIDLIEGLGKDLAAVDFIQYRIQADGILSTKNNLLKYGKEIGLITVQRLFLVDSRSFESGIKMVQSYDPDFVEVMPGIVPKAIAELKQKIPQPIIAGGMITCKQDIIQALGAGAVAVSTSKVELWEL